MNYIDQSQSYYSLIIAISKIARDIVEQENELGGSCPDNPIFEAVEKLKSGEYEIVMPLEV